MIEILDFSLKLIATIAAFVGGFWALTKYVIERGLVPAASLNIECEVIGEKAENKIIEVTVHITNQGSSVLVAKDIRLIFKTIGEKDELILYSDDKKYGRLRFPDPLNKTIENEAKEKTIVPFLLVPHDTFVQPGVDQKYSFVTTISKKVEFVHAHAEFQYAQKPKAIQNAVLKISRKTGLIQYSLEHIYCPHTIQRVFNVKTLANTPNNQINKDASR